MDHDLITAAARHSTEPRRKGPVLRDDGRVKARWAHKRCVRDATLPFSAPRNCQTKFKRRTVVLCNRPKRRAPKVAPADAQYTCPMHPEIIRDRAGAPARSAAMALEPMVPSMKASEELTDFTRRMWISAGAQCP